MAITSIRIDIGNIRNCSADIREAESASAADPNADFATINFHSLLANLRAVATESLPRLYQDNFSTPFIAFLERLGEGGFSRLFDGMSRLTSEEKFYKEIIPDVALAILAVANPELRSSTAAFQELVSDLFDGFLSAESRNRDGVRISPPDKGAIAPLVKWGSPENGPYTWPVDAVLGLSLSLKVPVVSLPPAYARRGVVAWAALGHETGGHDILHADTGLLQELALKVSQAVFTVTSKRKLADYWSSCIDETASDVLGILNMGPAAGIGLIAFFRGLTGGRLRAQGSWDDPHPADILRGYLAASVVKQLKFVDHEAWSTVIKEQTDHDFLEGSVVIYPNSRSSRLAISADDAKKSAEAVAQTIVGVALRSLENHALGEIQNWYDRDDGLAKEIQGALSLEEEKPLSNLSAPLGGEGYYAAHVVAGATYAVLQEGANIHRVFNRMISYLDEMHTSNPTWGQRAPEVHTIPHRRAALGSIAIEALSRMRAAAQPSTSGTH